MSDSSTPPPRPWKTGEHGEYIGAAFEVRFVEDLHGWVFSEHAPASPEDVEALGAMKNGGAQQVAYALVVEALRRETFLCLLAEMTRHPDIVEWCQDENYRKRLEQKLSGAALASVMGMAQKMLPDIARETVHRLSGPPSEGAKDTDPG